MAAQTPQRVRGTQDMLGEAAARFERVVDVFRQVARLYAFRPVQVPIFEATAVFARSLGETTDVVSKEMYSFEDRGGETQTQQPEQTTKNTHTKHTKNKQQHIP